VGLHLCTKQHHRDSKREGEMGTCWRYCQALSVLCADAPTPVRLFVALCFQHSGDLTALGAILPSLWPGAAAVVTAAHTLLLTKSMQCCW